MQIHIERVSCPALAFVFLSIKSFCVAYCTRRKDVLAHQVAHAVAQAPVVHAAAAALALDAAIHAAATTTATVTTGSIGGVVEEAEAAVVKARAVTATPELPL
jgi:hypothetical protein